MTFSNDFVLSMTTTTCAPKYCGYSIQYPTPTSDVNTASLIELQNDASISTLYCDAITTTKDVLFDDGCTWTSEIVTPTARLSFIVPQNLKNDQLGAQSAASSAFFESIFSSPPVCEYLEIYASTLTVSPIHNRPPKPLPTATSQVNAALKSVSASDRTSDDHPPIGSKDLSGLVVAMIVVFCCLAALTFFATYLWFRARRQHRQPMHVGVKHIQKGRSYIPKLHTICELPGPEFAVEMPTTQVSRATSKNRRLLFWLESLESKFMQGAKSSAGGSNYSPGTGSLSSKANTRSFLSQ